MYEYPSTTVYLQKRVLPGGPTGRPSHSAKTLSCRGAASRYPHLRFPGVAAFQSPPARMLALCATA